MATKYFDPGTQITEIWYKWQRVLRTLVQVGIPAFLTFALVLPQIISALGLPVDGPVYLWLVGAAGVVTAIAGALSRVMAIPAVNAWLVKIGLGSVPSSKVVDEPVGDAEPVADETPSSPDDALVDGDGLAAPKTD